MRFRLAEALGMTEAEVRERISGYELACWEILETVQPWGSRYLAACIIQAIQGGRLNDILKRIKPEPEEYEDNDEQFIEKIKSSIVNRK